MVDLLGDASDGRDAANNRLRRPLAELLAEVPAGWRSSTEPFASSALGQALISFVDGRVAAGATVYPGEVFRALCLTPPAQVRVVILGQDPYHGPNQAQGLAFSVPVGRPHPPSLRHVLAEVASDVGRPSTCGGDLSAWARQGVLLLNTVFTVEEAQPQSHAGRGWEALSDALLLQVAQGGRPVVFMLWGASAQRKAALLQSMCGGHVVLMANHPSPLSARRPPQPFLGCRHFSLANAALARLQPEMPPIEW